MRPEELSWIATGREESFFAPDIEANGGELARRLGGSRVMVIGGAGSIGSATVREIVKYGPESVHVVDTSENNLAELMRDLRGSASGLAVKDFRAMPVDYGSPVFHRLLRDLAP